MANQKDKLIKDLVIKVKAGDIDSAAKSAEKLSNALENAAAGGDLVDVSIAKLPSTLRTAVTVANEFKKTMNSKLGGSLTGQFGAVNSELKAVTAQLQTISKLSAGTISFKGFGSASTSAKKLADNLLDSSVAAELLESKLTSITSQMAEANGVATAFSTNMASAGNSAGFDQANSQLSKLNDTLELVLGEIAIMSEEMAHTSTLMVDKLTDIDSGMELVRRSSKKTSTSLGGLDDVLGRISGSSERAGRGLGNLKNHAQGAGREFSKLARIGGTVSLAYAMIAANVFAISAAWAYVERGDALTRMEKSSNALAASTGKITNGMAAMIQQVSGFSVDYETAMRTAASATVYGFDTKTIEDFTRIARGASTVLGGEMTDMLNRLVKGTAKQEREMLDELGIMVRVDTAQKDYANALGKTVNSLTSYEKSQAFANAVAKEGMENFGELGDTLSNATPVEKATARVKELSRSLSQLIAQTISPIIISITEKSQESKAADEAFSARKNLEEYLKQAEGKAKSGDAVQAISLLSQAFSEQEKVLSSANKAMKSYDEQYNSIADAMNKGKDTGVLVPAFAIENLRDASISMNELQKESSKLFSSQSQSIASILGISANSLEKNQKEVGDLVNKFNAAHTISKSLKNEIDGIDVTMKRTVTPVDNMAKQFAAAHNEIDGLAELLETKLVQSMPKVGTAIRAMIDRIIKSTGAADMGQLVDTEFAYDQVSEFSKRELDRKTELARLSGTSLDSNQSALAVSKQSLANAERELELQQFRLGMRPQDEEAQDRSKELEAEILGYKKEQMDLNYSIAQQAIDNNDALKNATIIMQDQTEATKNRLQAEQALLTAKQKVALAGTAADSASAISERAQAEMELRDAILEEAKSNDLIASKQRMQLGYQKDLKAYMTGHISYQAEILQAQEDLTLATSELDRLNKEGLKYEEQRLDLMQAQAEAQMKISQAKAQEIIARVEESQVGSSRGDSGGVSTALREQEEARAKVQALYADENTRYTLEYRDAVNDLTQATYEYVTAMQAKKREEVNTVFGAMGTSQISSIEGLTGQDLTDTLRADNLANYTAALDTIASYNPAMTEMITNMGQLTNAFIAFGQGAVNASQLVAPVLNTLSSAMTASSQAAIDDIQNQIDMEKKLDGNSEKSKAKIAKLEAQKAAEQKKQAINTIITQTAVGMAQALGSMPYPYNLVAMGTVAAAGLMALKQAQSGNTIISASDSSPESLTLGDRSNRVDTSLAATAGESAYIRGDHGTGSIQKFTPRASGGKAYAGTTILAGENGPEPITLGADAVVTSNSDSRKAGANQVVSLSINAVDARSFQDLLATDPKFITSLVEAQLNERGLSLG